MQLKPQIRVSTFYAIFLFGQTLNFIQWLNSEIASFVFIVRAVVGVGTNPCHFTHTTINSKGWADCYGVEVNVSSWFQMPHSEF